MAVLDLTRNRFRVLLSVSDDPDGFIVGQTRVPDIDFRAGYGLTDLSFWDGNNQEALDRFGMSLSGGQIHYRWTRSNIIRGQEWLIAGIGDHTDLQFSGLLENSGIWFPVITCGHWFDLDHPTFLFSNAAIETVISGDQSTTICTPPFKEFVPISCASFVVDEFGRTRHYEEYRQKTSFTSVSVTEPTFTQVSGTNPILYNRTVSGIRWSYVDTANPEFVAIEGNKIVLNKPFVSGVSVSIRRVPWNREVFQLPLVPVVSESTPQFRLLETPVWILGGSSTLPFAGSQVSDFMLMNRQPFRVAGYFGAGSDSLIVTTSISGLPSAGRLVIDDGDFRQEVLSYDGYDGTTFNIVNRPTPMHHRTGAAIHFVLEGAISSGNQVFYKPDGHYVANYTTSNVSYSLNRTTGQMQISGLNLIPRVTMTLNYLRGLLLCYEPNTAGNVLQANIDLNPLKTGANHGLVWASLAPVYPHHIDLIIQNGINSDGTIGPIYAGNDYVALRATVLDKNGIPVPNAPVTLAIGGGVRLGYVDGAAEPLVKTTDLTGTVYFVYTPPDTIQDLGYFVSLSGVISGCQLHLEKPVDYDELADSSGWTTRIYTVWDDSPSLPFSFVSGINGYSAEGRFEILAQRSVSQGHYIFSPLQPLMGQTTTGSPAGNGDEVATLIFPSGSLPSDPTLKFYFVSAQRKIGVGAVVVGSTAVSPAYNVVIGIPPFMQGEFMWGPQDDPQTKALDSLAYLTLNPLHSADFLSNRVNPASCGHVFRIRQTGTNLLRQKFYINPDFDVLSAPGNTEGNQYLRQTFTFRNRFIVETRS